MTGHCRCTDVDSRSLHSVRHGARPRRNDAPANGLLYRGEASKCVLCRLVEASVGAGNCNTSAQFELALLYSAALSLAISSSG
jgi:hypothetical protein